MGFYCILKTSDCVIISSDAAVILAMGPTMRWVRVSGNCFQANIKVPFGLSPVSSCHHTLLSYVRILFWMLQLGIEVRVHGFLSLNPHLLLLSVTTSDLELVQ